MARSPSYPRISLDKAVKLIRKVYESAHKSSLDTETLVQLLGYSGKSGPALGTLAALRQYGLLDGRDEDIHVSDDAMGLLEPLNKAEYREKYAGAALKPPLFKELFQTFGKTPPADGVIKSLVIRKYGFTSTGAQKLTRSYLETMASLPTNDVTQPDDTTDSAGDGTQHGDDLRYQEEVRKINAANAAQTTMNENVLQFPLTKGSSARVEFFGEISRETIMRLIRHLELSAEIYDEAASE
jgi:hypothetical protein